MCALNFSPTTTVNDREPEEITYAYDEAGQETLGEICIERLVLFSITNFYISVINKLQ